MYLLGGGLVRLRECLSDLAESEARVAAFILNEPGHFPHLTVQDLAKQSNSSQAAVVRLWKSLGFDGYRDFQLRVASDLQSGTDNPYVELQSGNTFSQIVDSVHKSSAQSIQNTLKLLKESDVQQAVRSLVEAKRILTFGVGASGTVASDFSQKLLRIGFPVYIAQDFHTAATLAAQLEENDVLVAVSYSGQTSDVYEVTEIAVRNGAHTIAITRYADTPLHKLASLCLHISAMEPQTRVAATASRISALAIIDTLFLYLANSYPNRVYPFLEATRSVVKSHRMN